MVVSETLGVMLIPVPNNVPPVGAVYQLMVPLLAIAESVTRPGPQRSPGVVLFIIGVEFTVATTAVRGAEVQPFSVVST